MIEKKGKRRLKAEDRKDERKVKKKMGRRII